MKKYILILTLTVCFSSIAHADYSTTLTHADGSKTTIYSHWSTKSSTITNYNKAGKQTSVEVVPGGAGKWDTHKSFYQGYMKANTKVKSKSPTNSPIGDY